jgi:UDP-N-acetylmuramoylalanine--D-glutamate ligase
MDEAVSRAAALAHRGDTVLLSPACASQDMFRDYRERGEQFARAARELPP